MNGYFTLQITRADGSIQGAEPVRVQTDTGVILNCHPKVNVQDVRRLCEIARDTPDYPIDLSAWSDDCKTMIWSARLYWRNDNV